MGKLYDRRDDVRLNDTPFALERRVDATAYKKSYVLWDRVQVPNRIFEIEDSQLTKFFDVVDVLRALHDDGELRPPTPAKLAQWDQEEEEQLLTERYENEDPATLRHVADLLEKRAAKRKLEKRTAKNSQRRTP